MSPRGAFLVFVASAALALSACGKKGATAMGLCQQLEAAGVAKECHDTSSTVCKYARERATFATPSGGVGQAFRFANGTQFDLMMKIAGPAKTGLHTENRDALVLVQIAGDVPDETAQKVKDILDRLPPAPASELVADPTCAK
jgi:hypothetical protein